MKGFMVSFIPSTKDAKDGKLIYSVRIQESNFRFGGKSVNN